MKVAFSVEYAIVRKGAALTPTALHDIAATAVVVWDGKGVEPGEGVVTERVLRAIQTATMPGPQMEVVIGDMRRVEQSRFAEDVYL